MAYMRLRLINLQVFLTKVLFIQKKTGHMSIFCAKKYIKSTVKLTIFKIIAYVHCKMYVDCQWYTIQGTIIGYLHIYYFSTVIHVYSCLHSYIQYQSHSLQF